MAQASSAQPSQATELRSVLADAIASHPSLRARQAEVGAAQSDVDAARWQYAPTPSLSVQHPDKALIAGTDRSVTLLALKQPLWTGGRLDAGMAYASARQQTAQANREETRRDIALEIIQAWGEVCSARERVKVFEGSADAHRQLHQQIQRRTRAGLSVQSDIALAGSRLQAVLADLSNARAAQDAAQERLHTLLGHSVAHPLLPGSQAAAVQGVGENDAVQTALANDPTLARMKSEATELQAQAASAASAYWPDVYASISQRHGDVTGRIAQISIGFESKWGAGLSTAAALQAASQRLQAKHEDIDYRGRKLAEQVRADQRQLEAVGERVRAYTQALTAAKDVADSWDRQFAAGKKTWQDVMNAARESAQTEIQLVDATGARAVLEWRLAVLVRGVDGVLNPEQVKP
jgi:adhesin transport system outer membrane protein